MRGGKGAVAHGLLIAVLLPAGRLEAAPVHGVVGDLAARVQHLFTHSFLMGPGPRPQAVAPADSQGPSVNPANLEQPAQLERELRAALRKPLMATRLTVVGGMARLGHYTIGSAETVHGHVVVLEGDAEVRGRLEGNLVTLDGNITVFPGAAVEGDVLAIGGRVIEASGVTGSVQNLEAVEPPATSTISRSVLRADSGAWCRAPRRLLHADRPGLRPRDLRPAQPRDHLRYGRAFLWAECPCRAARTDSGAPDTRADRDWSRADHRGRAAGPVCDCRVRVARDHCHAGRPAGGGACDGRANHPSQDGAGRHLSPNSYRYLWLGLVSLATIWVAWVAFGWVPFAGGLMFAVALLTSWGVGRSDSALRCSRVVACVSSSPVGFCRPS